jgi:lysozyme
MIPRNRPRIERKTTEQLLRLRKVSDPVCLVGIRGYYRDSMGAVGKQDRGIYDDALILVSPNVHAAFNANVDPGAYGKNPKIGKGYASLKPGVYRYKLGKHGLRGGNPYRALVQGNPVTVSRDGGEDETGYFGINIHKGSNRSVSSEGCQTIPPAQWPAFITLVETEMKRNNAKTLSYVLTSKS